MAKRVVRSMPVMPVRDSKVGHWAFLIGVVLAVIAGLVPALQTPKIAWVLVGLGLIVGLLNITARETEQFLVATVALVIAADAAGDIIQLGYTAAVILGNVVTFVFPAALIVAFKTIWVLASEE
ncbi:hypothetical protein C4580_01690 [Candidatus Woesearchaeota archaeon]|nr:MAG: hypothetical protein C4580_01690 [Candidatus Woesearchaeota archaeon]